MNSSQTTNAAAAAAASHSKHAVDDASDTHREDEAAHAIHDAPDQRPDDEPHPSEPYTTSPDIIAEAKHYCDVLHHLHHYLPHTLQYFQHHFSDFTALPQTYQHLVPGYQHKVQSITNAIHSNYQFIEYLLYYRSAFMHWNVDWQRIEAASHDAPIDSEKMSKVRSTIRQCVRDWSSDGAAERATCYGPLLAGLKQYLPDAADKRVLVPGSGLGRLVWECANAGYTAEGNEFSYFMLIASFFLLNIAETPDDITLYPYVSETKNHYRVEDQLHSIRIPDVNPKSLPPDSKLSMVAGDFLEIYNDVNSSAAEENGEIDPSVSHKESFDAVAACYFIDCAPNIFEYISTIAYILKPGGYWLNFGPLLYHFSDLPGEHSIDLSWEEVKAALPAFGLKLVEERCNQESSYTADPRSMMQTVYRCVYAVIQKVGADTTRSAVFGDRCELFKERRSGTLQQQHEHGYQHEHDDAHEHSHT